MKAAEKLIATVAASLSLAAAVTAQCEKAALTAFDGDIQEEFGRSTAIEDPFAAVGAPFHPIGVGSGAVYIHSRAGTAWSLDQKIEAADNDPGDFFGYSVSLSDSRVVVGAREDDANGTDAGAAYVFRRDPGGWVQEQKLVPSISTPEFRFGTSCSLDGDRVAVAAPAQTPGRVWTFTRTGTTWSQEAELAPTVPGTDFFGQGLALDGNRLAVGAPGTNYATFKDGTVHVFKLHGTTWVEQQVLVSPNPTVGGAFGTTTALSGDRLAVGAFAETSAAGFTGRAYVYSEVAGVWTLEAELLPSELQNGDKFGSSVSIDGINLVVGAMLGDGPAPDSGTSYLFQYNGSSWVRVSRFWGSTSGSGDQFGVSVSLHGLYIIGGANFHGSQEGTAYIFGRCP